MNQTKNKKTLNLKQKQSLKNFYISISLFGVFLIGTIIFSIFGFSGYSYTVDVNGQFLNQPGLVFIDPKDGSQILNGGTEGQELYMYIYPFVKNGNVRLLLSFCSIICLIATLAFALISFFYFLNSKNIPPKIKEKYKDSINLKNEHDF
ncbi:hypothetical protein [Mycoplasmoides alvi]|uniref:hypothetical protein n=1 Tax=Mycoplasmoides alvi TaxID=78580 RepID=UPI00051C4C7C|nr:hypothetical protein [Mycoplasmoides alvi]